MASTMLPRSVFAAKCAGHRAGASLCGNSPPGRSACARVGVAVAALSLVGDVLPYLWASDAQAARSLSQIAGWRSVVPR